MRALKKDGDMIFEMPLYVAVNSVHRSIEIVRSLLKRGADPNKGQMIRDKDGVYVETPLFMASSRGYTEIVRSLLASEARLDLDTGEDEENLADHHYHYCQSQLCHHHHQQACQRTGIRKNLSSSSL